MLKGNTTKTAMACSCDTNQQSHHNHPQSGHKETSRCNKSSLFKNTQSKRFIEAAQGKKNLSFFPIHKWKRANQSQNVGSKSNDSELAINKDDARNAGFPKETSTCLFANIVITHRQHSGCSTGLTMQKSDGPGVWSIVIRLARGMTHHSSVSSGVFHQ